jgi:putative addiction module component (TIGR02574 family)
MTQALRSEIDQLSLSEKMLLVEDLWDEIAQHDEEIELSEEIRQELDRCHEEFLANPREGRSWEEVKQRILNQA